ncbi:hypothetical protein [Clostridium sp. BJN0013]|uniref:hypothetical protein n=1 Tax=Clostridium sp. BJN0013 TaxID=3236840 RepID=UPI0034C5C0EB
MSGNSNRYNAEFREDAVITQEEFFKDVSATGNINTIEKNSKQYKVGTTVNPEKLIDKLEKEK